MLVWFWNIIAFLFLSLELLKVFYSDFQVLELSLFRVELQSLIPGYLLKLFYEIENLRLQYRLVVYRVRERSIIWANHWSSLDCKNLDERLQDEVLELIIEKVGVILFPIKPVFKLSALLIGINVKILCTLPVL